MSALSLLFIIQIPCSFEDVDTYRGTLGTAIRRGRTRGTRPRERTSKVIQKHQVHYGCFRSTPIPSMSDTILDSLPYYDVDLEQPSLRALVDAEIALELRRTPKLATDPRVPPDFRQFAVSTILLGPLLECSKVIAS
jgi:Breast carcinoma amplified sequence 2 (BCAS2)